MDCPVKPLNDELVPSGADRAVSTLCRCDGFRFVQPILRIRYCGM